MVASSWRCIVPTQGIVLKSDQLFPKANEQKEDMETTDGKPDCLGLTKDIILLQHTENLPANGQGPGENVC